MYERFPFNESNFRSISQNTNSTLAMPFFHSALETRMRETFRRPSIHYSKHLFSIQVDLKMVRLLMCSVVDVLNVLKLPKM